MKLDQQEYYKLWTVFALKAEVCFQVMLLRNLTNREVKQIQNCIA